MATIDIAMESTSQEILNTQALESSVQNILTRLDNLENNMGSSSSGGGFQAILGDPSQNILAELQPPAGTYSCSPGATLYKDGLAYGNYFYSTTGSYMQFFYLNLKTGETTSIGTISSISPIFNQRSADTGIELFSYNDNLYFLGRYSNVCYICKYEGGTTWSKTAVTRADGLGMSYPKSIYVNQDGLYAFGMYHSSSGTSNTAPQGIFKFNFSTNQFELLQTSTYYFDNQSSQYGRPFPKSRKLLVPYGSYTNYLTGFLIFNTETNTIETTISAGINASSYYMYFPLYMSPNEKVVYWSYTYSSTGTATPRYFQTNLLTGVNTADSSWRQPLGYSNNLFYYNGHPFVIEVDSVDTTLFKIKSLFDYLEVAVPESAQIIIGNPNKNISYMRAGNTILVQTSAIGATTFNSSISIII